jgi:predicted RNA-binding Zn-ribbon protein involved in translation (DUF1610 family)
MNNELLKLFDIKDDVVETFTVDHKESNYEIDIRFKPSRFSCPTCGSTHFISKGDSYHNMEDMYKKLRNNTADNPDGENIISNKVGIKSMDWIYSNESKDGYVYLLHWTSDDGKKIQAELYKNKQVKITSIE